MTEYTVTRLDEIDPIDDGRIVFRAVRHHFGIRTFGINAMTARAAGDRLIGEHAETEPDSSEELYLVVSGHARFELDGASQRERSSTYRRESSERRSHKTPARPCSRSVERRRANRMRPAA